MFRIGEFAHIAQVPTSQLRYYDEIGLLKPAETDQWTSYRFYSTRQLPRLHRILALRELGLPLEQIKRLLEENISAEEMRGMFTLRKAQVEQTLREELIRLRQLEARLQHLEAGVVPDGHDVIIKSLPAMPFIGTRVVMPTIYDAYGIVKQLLKAVPLALGKDAVGHVTVLFHSDFFTMEQCDLSVGLALKKPANTSIQLTDGLLATTQLLPAMPQVASVIRHGGPEHNITSHASIGAWAERNQYTVAGEGREIVIVPPRGKGDRSDMVTEVMLPVSPKLPI